MKENKDKKDNSQADKNSSHGKSIKNELSKVATDKKKSTAILVLVILIAGSIAYWLNSGTKTVEKPKPLPGPSNVNVGYKEPASNIYIPPQVVAEPSPAPKATVHKNPDPPAPKEDIKNDLPPLPTPTADTSVPLPSPAAIHDSKGTNLSRKQKAEMTNRMKSSIMLVNNPGISHKNNSNHGESLDVQYVGNAKNILIAGKIIDAVLETAINSDFPSELRAIVSRDVYSSNGNIVLIPRGSRLLGAFSVSTGSSNQGRVSIIWNSILMPSGYVVNLSSANTVDNLGIQGVQGRVDTKSIEKLSNSLLTSVFSIAVAKTLDHVVPPPSTSDTANANSQKLTSFLNIVTSTLTSQDTEKQKINQICAVYPKYLTDINADSYKNVSQACNIAQTNPNGLTDVQLLSNLVNSLNAATIAYTQSSIAATETGQSSKAVVDAYKNFTDTIQDVITQNNFNTTVTVPQGRQIKILVNKSIFFPERSIMKSKMVQ